MTNRRLGDLITPADDMLIYVSLYCSRADGSRRPGRKLWSTGYPHLICVRTCPSPCDPMQLTGNPDALQQNHH